MAHELDRLNVAALKELARKHLGKGFSRLKTKADLVGALRRIVGAMEAAADTVSARPPLQNGRGRPSPSAKKAAAGSTGKAERPAPPAKADKTSPARIQSRTDQPVVKRTASSEMPAVKRTASTEIPAVKRIPTAELPAVKRAESTEISAVKRTASGTQPAAIAADRSPSSSGPRGVAAPEKKASGGGKGGGDKPSGKGSREKAPAAPSEAPSPVSEGFFVVRVAGPVEAERHHLTESSGAQPPPSRPAPYTGYDEQLGELPDLYEDDAELLLPRDPHTLFFLWDFAPDSRRGAMAGLSNPRARLRVYDGETLVREQDFALEQRSHYLHGLNPGRSYRVEAYFVGDHGAYRRLGRGTNVVALPADRASDNLEIRFMRIPWDVPLAQLREVLRMRRLTQPIPSPARVPLPSSQTSRALQPSELRPPHLGPAVRVAMPSSHGPSQTVPGQR